MAYDYDIHMILRGAATRPHAAGGRADGAHGGSSSSLDGLFHGKCHEHG